MRDKYIELIKEYVKEKPQYRYILSALKEDVMSVGATEEEFDEAVRQMSGLPNASAILNEANNPSKKIDLKTYYQKLQPKANQVFQISKHQVIKKKKFVAAAAFCVIVLLVSIQIIKTETPQKTNIVSQASQIKIPIANGGSIPIVYANTQPIDPEKIFSTKSKNVQLTVTGKPKKEILGFFPYWILPKEDQINLQTLTSVSLFGLEVDGNGNIVTGGSDTQSSGGWAMWKDPKLDDFIRRARSRNLKVYLTLKSFNSSNIDSIAQSDNSQKNLIANALYLVNSKNLDGINIDFEYSGSPTTAVRDGFTRLITNLNAELKRQIPGSTLTIDTYLVSGSEKGIFNIPILSQNSDAFVIMGYDMHTPLGAPGPVSAMGGDTNIVGYVQNYLEQIPASKLILAIPYYGYDWPSDVASPSADMVKILPYAEIADESKNLDLSWNDTSQTPYFTYKDDGGRSRIVHFDNVRSLGIKYDFIARKNLRGVGIWALGYDGQNQDLEKLLIDKFINQ